MTEEIRQLYQEYVNQKDCKHCGCEVHEDNAGLHENGNCIKNIIAETQEQE